MPSTTRALRHPGSCTSTVSTSCRSRQLKADAAGLLRPSGTSTTGDDGHIPGQRSVVRHGFGDNDRPCSFPLLRRMTSVRSRSDRGMMEPGECGRDPGRCLVASVILIVVPLDRTLAPTCSCAGDHRTIATGCLHHRSRRSTSLMVEPFRSPLPGGRLEQPHAGVREGAPCPDMMAYCRDRRSCGSFREKQRACRAGIAMRGPGPAATGRRGRRAPWEAVDAVPCRPLSRSRPRPFLPVPPCRSRQGRSR